MARPPLKSVEDKTRIVMAVLREEISIAEAARREGVSQTSIANWRDQFLEGGQAAIAAGRPGGPVEPGGVSRGVDRDVDVGWYRIVGDKAKPDSGHPEGRSNANWY